MTARQTPDPARMAAWYPTLAPSHVALLADACRVYGLDPDPKRHNILAVRGGGGVAHFQIDYVSFVTAGGVKLRHPADLATTETLRRIFRAWRIEHDPVTRAEIAVPLPLPDDLTLPPEICDGQPRKRSDGNR